MPELPEVETVRRGLQPLCGATLKRVEVREVRFRKRISSVALRRLVGRRLATPRRRAKYLLAPTEGGGGMIVHLGMSGRLFMAAPGTPVGAHDHVSWWFDAPEGVVELRLRDPRRFGMVVALRDGALDAHSLLASLGPEPLGESFSAQYLREASRGSRRPVKNALMDSQLVAGVGNIYASEALWVARVNPKTGAGRISVRRWEKIRSAVRRVLKDAIEAGGTTLNDFRGADGASGYFQVSLAVYGRAGMACRRCGRPIRKIVQAGRATYYCGGCQH